jgi:hypothetical protein
MAIPANKGGLTAELFARDVIVLPSREHVRVCLSAKRAHGSIASKAAVRIITTLRAKNIPFEIVHHNLLNE